MSRRCAAASALDLSRMKAIIEVNPVGHGLPHRGRGDAPAAQPASARPGPVLPRRSRHRGLHHRRHVCDAGERHQRGALRHHPRAGARPHRGAGRWAGDPHRRPRAQIRQWLRPHPADDRLRGHPWASSRKSSCGCTASPRPPPPPSRLPVRPTRRRRGHGDRDPAGRHSRRPDGTARRRADGRLHRLFESCTTSPPCRRCSSSSTAPRRG